MINVVKRQWIVCDLDILLPLGECFFSALKIDLFNQPYEYCLTQDAGCGMSLPRQVDNSDSLRIQGRTATKIP